MLVRKFITLIIVFSLTLKLSNIHTHLHIPRRWEKLLAIAPILIILIFQDNDEISNKLMTER